MTPALLMARNSIIYWVNAWLAPLECMFDMIESELARRGVAPDEIDYLPHTRETTSGVLAC
ncbi:hypothetical protein [Bradyrhizobium uaiense]|uniref:Uncharacterized protein n=1 Tax=Bradyrhizobium uaiense TaxID=2594946 RepID=A0A6P1BEA8_9BRAD|nr:hypothetical protein [Bradyrhizobium uaiense]NEU95802.1 hypothetical protein [Bradyrhizobium uaiense]